ncbi:hypothetical protein I7I53_10595 [Histoplasma capsulatum var. duboisii H88]|uniref:Uncharacterized protein n=1 Tax=Ajellomyces capsulatus (strain H88) TaxID=544711 RepID=A0A8A1LC60_AJEC8|nr:hypothetical protein I7I53_10595 [Histoplasma capsulatum var. duboisii H88]
MSFRQVESLHLRAPSCSPWANHLLNQGSSRTCLADALADGSNFNNFPMICPSLTMSSLVRSGLFRPSKYTSSSHSCKLDPVFSVALPSPVFIVSHIPCHLSGISSLAISRIWPTRIAGVIKKVSKGGWPVKSSKSCCTYQFTIV